MKGRSSCVGGRSGGGIKGGAQHEGAQQLCGGGKSGGGIKGGAQHVTLQMERVRSCTPNYQK